MRRYIRGYYCKEESSIQILNKKSNREILKALREKYPGSLNAQEIANMTGRPENTVYAQLSELYDNNFVEILGKERQRGRPPASEKISRADRYIIENLPRELYLRYPYDYAPAPGVVEFYDGFLEAFHEILDDKELREFDIHLINFIERTLRRFKESRKDAVRKWMPTTGQEMCCKHCGMNHEARDFIQALLLHTIDHLYEDKRFIELLKGNELLTDACYQRLLTEIKEDEGDEVEDDF